MILADRSVVLKESIQGTVIVPGYNIDSLGAGACVCAPNEARSPSLPSLSRCSLRSEKPRQVVVVHISQCDATRSRDPTAPDDLEIGSRECDSRLRIHARALFHSRRVYHFSIQSWDDTATTDHAPFLFSLLPVHLPSLSVVCFFFSANRRRSRDIDPPQQLPRRKQLFLPSSSFPSGWHLSFLSFVCSRATSRASFRENRAHTTGSSSSDRRPTTTVRDCVECTRDTENRERAVRTAFNSGRVKCGDAK